jgi:predicted  nucleic acid-binding Zn-ribbon protein
MFPEADIAAEQLETLVDGWKSQLEALETQISSIRSKIAEKAYLTEDVKIDLFSKLGELKRKKQELSAKFFAPDGYYDKAIKEIMLPIEKKINIYIENLKREE